MKIVKMKAEKSKSFVYKRKNDGSLATRFSRIKDAEHGTAVNSYKSQKMKESHLPVELWLDQEEEE